jgi:hypothetical protein
MQWLEIQRRDTQSSERLKTTGREMKKLRLWRRKLGKINSN